MFSPAHKVYFVEIPKNASRCITTLLDKSARGNTYLPMHEKTSKCMQILEDDLRGKLEKIVAILRDPRDRLVSMANYLDDYFLDDLLKHIANNSFNPEIHAGREATMITKPQKYFLDGGFTYNLFTMDTIDALCSFCDLGPPHIENESHKKYTLEDLKKSKYYEAAINVYKDDFWLYDLVSKNQTDEGFVWKEKELEECM